MRISVSLMVAASMFAIGASARAQQPLQPYETAEEPAEAVEAPAPIPPAQIPVQQPIDPYSAYPAPPAYGYQSPAAGPAATPSPPSYQQGYYLYPSDGKAPVYYAPPAGSGCCCCCQAASCGYRYRLVRPVKRKPWDGVRRFSLGAHAGFLTLNQQVGGDQVTLGGAGFQLRIRSAGHWGFEASQSFLHGSYWSGAWQRDTFPFSLSLMFYIFPNRDAHHFNLYALAGVGLVADTVTLNDENRQQVSQDFTEVEVHAGVGAELRFKWFAIEADARYISLWRDDSSTPASYYGSVGGAPVQSSSYGIQGNVYLSLWF
jgi:Outer membrane protein beta-barrel domain